MKLNNDMVSQLRSVQFGQFGDIFKKFQALSAEYGGMPMENIVSAFARVTGGNYARNNPYIQNRRVKQISSMPAKCSKDQVADMIENPVGNEQPLRQVAHALEYTAYPLFHMRRVYQELMSYHNYITPLYVEEAEAKKDEFWREWRLLEKMRKELNPAAWAHQIAGQILQEGKVFYVPRVSLDKVHNQVNHAFMQQLPSDWTKIVGFNNVSKYTVAFNLFYFMQPGTDPAQFGDLFEPYMSQFGEMVSEGRPTTIGKNLVYAQQNPSALDLEKYQSLKRNGKIKGDAEAYYQNGNWYYWVTLPPDKVFTFEVDDTNRNVVSPFTGLFISMMQLAQYEAIQLELVQNPLISLLTGEIPYRDTTNAGESDAYKLSNAGIKLFEAMWYQMLAANNTSGVGLYMAPLENMQMHQLAEAPGATEISTNGYGYAMAKAGLGAIIPTSDDPRAGVAQISVQIESRFAQSVYTGFERMMNQIFKSLNLKYEWGFRMFGNMAEDDSERERLQKDMTLGILPATLKYLALSDLSLIDDIAISNAVIGSGILDKRLPLISSYSAKQGEGGLPPQAAHDMNPGGRPSSDGAATSEAQEDSLDAYGDE